MAADPVHQFEIDPATLIDAYRNVRAGGPRIAGCYHSHPGGDPQPSAEDAAQADGNGWLWLICAGPPWRVRLWRAVPDGRVLGRFDPVDLA
jgi:proteasome lid subunit RPN8/RPN11